LPQCSDPNDKQSRYIEAAISGILLGCIYLPNGNPQPGPKFQYKLEWFKRLTAHAKWLLAQDDGTLRIVARGRKEDRASAAA
jgi:exonuclease III